MKRALLITLVASLAACSSRPFEKTETVYDPLLLTQKSNYTNVRVHRVNQLTGSALGDDCPLVLKVDNIEVVGLQQNQYVDLYLPEGKHTLSIRFKCALTEWRKSVDLNADGRYQEYSAESGGVGQYRMLRVK
ncbi:hypothetical protein [Candidatus Pantoea formicae]|uniref:hypothetical protein n=1 Tax=Candidatus Pantoea formicae TaxID=2608355 RepID=UPI003ED97C24